MNSKIAEGIDSDFDYMQWAGKEYIMERMKEEYPDAFHTGESSKQIYRQADANTVNTMYYGYHTLYVRMAIDRMKKAGTHRKSIS
ncbi:MAG: hypothetical protein ACI32N_00585 [Bulleidia sp.]